MREIHMHARGKVVSAEHSRAAREEEEMRRMLEGLAIKQTRQEEEMARRFAEREKKLWAVSVLLPFLRVGRFPG